MNVKITAPDGTVYEFDTAEQTKNADPRCPKHGSVTWMAVVPPPCTCGKEIGDPRRDGVTFASDSTQPWWRR